MSYAIIRNTNYKMKNLAGIYRHNERKNTNYSNKDINKHNSTKNYSIKVPYSTYEKVFRDLRNQYHLEGQIKNISNVMCELIITVLVKMKLKDISKLLISLYQIIKI